MSDLHEPDGNDGPGCELRGGRQQQVQAWREEDGQPENFVGREPINKIERSKKK